MNEGLEGGEEREDMMRRYLRDALGWRNLD